MKLHDFTFIGRIFIMTVLIVIVLFFFILFLSQKISDNPPHKDRYDKLEMISELVSQKMIDKNALDRLLSQVGSTEVKMLSREELNKLFYESDVERLMNHSLRYIVAPSKRPGQWFFVTKTAESFLCFQIPPPPPPPFKNRRGPMPLVIFISIVAFAIVSVLVSFSILYIKLRVFSKKAAIFISSIQQGKFDTRFQISKNDAFYESMMQFNTMAQQVEKLVDKIKNSEQIRIEILQELSHDLRTPIASLKNLIETLRFASDNITKEEKKELMQLASAEMVYFERLVEDLLMWARINEPKYQEQKEEIHLVNLLDGELIRLESIYPKILIEKNYHSIDVHIMGNAYLLKRMFRNVLENAVEHAHNKVTISINVVGKFCEIQIMDDGDGFSVDQINSYGKKKFSRVALFSDSTRLSIGLGSVIVSNIVKLHDGILNIKNKGGANVIIQLPVPG
ncbi:MAG: hypothetical protein A2381_16875 [Bdellovibrionales bacterium RIFOXYB1_FULL_37_110]|nr:MAG: hypothetical protein A2181_07880 [Bdellovibrionales bacterium RIFOXYA1_FULL_38_20]OFZ50072.1 MAG: hypothetical protein A2417_18710 [Bdellovibrionales bacterium RIFOXYC1_FULL_37_79]OFZ59978.1 MAG: hypothetical protein A2381_16875 [Bdellovibrionales bacterium RIFOXYB1_FULL_37_110]OFZ63949.1 MAG: hypothetical protein A2577_06065 [Bdellovibrionales bacterium RIFOXYD1_FULL_36_51]OFZ65660.1 MAG: hypothetical protein A2328_04290 [Bdellovibrionales bacterium RIFOXYB2_FULL_36_6]